MDPTAQGDGKEPPEPVLDPIWKALADPTRRHVLERLRGGPCTTGDLARGFQMSRFGVMKHLRRLQEAGLVRVEVRGRERWNHLEARLLVELYPRWIRRFEATAPAEAPRPDRLEPHAPSQENRACK